MMNRITSESPELSGDQPFDKLHSDQLEALVFMSPFIDLLKEPPS